MEVDHEVKNEAEEKDAPPSEHRKEISEEQDDNTTLAQVSQTSKVFAPSTPMNFQGIQKKPKVKTEKRVPVKKSRSDSKPSNVAVSEHSGKCLRSCKQKKALVQAKSSAMIRAEEVQSNLDSEFPSFVKSMVRSYVASCFWMGLPVTFCKSHLPRKETILTLEDEHGEKSEVKYIADKTALSGGWRQFSLCHKLLEGDVLIFQLVEPIKFKVYIIRANDSIEVDGALNLLNLDASTKENDPVASNNAKRKRCPKSLPLAIAEKKKNTTGLTRSYRKLKQTSEQSGNDNSNLDSEVLEGSRFLGPAGQFKEIVNYDEFHILVNGLLVDSELSEDIRYKYYNLCCTKNALLHEHLVMGLNTRLISGIISETVNIADAIRACDLTTPRDVYTSWETTLKAFEVLGMNVSFLRARLDQLVSLAFESEGAMEKKKCMEVRNEQAHTEEEIRNLKAKLVELEEVSERFGADIETLKLKAENFELKFHEEVTAPW